ncbi:MAG: hypothetical protein LLF92_09040 [Planctomycetaceae bacterium]|nr:hypothetical protein [Planctomycetaceae bacterium]
MNGSDGLITVGTVNWYSSDYLEKLFKNLLEKAASPEKIRFLIIDNTNGKDADIEKLKSLFQNITIEKNNPGNLKGSAAHSSGLNVLMQNIHTPYALIIDPDVHVFKKEWDKFLINLLNQNHIFAAGVSFPPWQLGMYHNFPNPVFCFLETAAYRSFAPEWSAYDVSKIILYWDFLRRNLLRCGILINRQLYENSTLARRIWSFLERVVGVCSRDTGWRRAVKAKNNNIKTPLFVPKIVSSKNFTADNPLDILAKYFELYCHGNEPILTHKYSTNSAVFKTIKSGDSDLWGRCIEQIEKLY